MIEASLDKLSPIPLYVQLADWLERSIQDGRYAIGAKLPPEEQLADTFDLNRNTVRHAISVLVDKGVLSRKKGIGTFVRRKHGIHPVHTLGEMVSFVDDFNASDIRIEDRLTEQSVIPAPAEIAALLEVKAEDRLVKIERLRLADGTPFLLETQYYTCKDFGRLSEIEITGSMYKILTDQFHADLDHALQTIRAVLPSQPVAQKLGISTSTPCLYIESLAYTAEDKCIEVLRSYYRGDRYLFRVQTGSYGNGIRVDRTKYARLADAGRTGNENTYVRDL
jgi:GntR family transcriptional regulator